MKLKLNLLLVFLAIFTLSEARTTGDTLKVMSYNLRFGELASMEEFGEFIKNEGSDIVMLQELDWKTNRTRAPKQNGVAMLNILAYTTELFGIYGKSLDYTGGYYGIGLLSRYPIISSKRVFLPNPAPKKEQRVLLEAQIELPGNRIVTAISTHLEYSSEEQRQAQVDFINEYIKNIDTPVILGGDLNARPDSEEIEKGFAHWGKASNDDFTSPASNPRRKIDYLYVYPAEAFEVLHMSTDQNQMSDHLPVMSEIILK